MGNSLINSQNDAELKAKYNPEGSQLRQIQYRELDILIEFDRICRIHNIDYWLDSGTLIGAVRHGGFIPWDDDIDICVLKKDWKKLEKAMKESVGEDYEYSGYGKKSKLPHPRLYDKYASVKRKLKGRDVIADESLWLDVLLMEPGSLITKRVIENTYGKCLRRVWNYMDDGRFKHSIALIAYPFTFVFKLIISGLCYAFHSNTLVHCYGNALYSIRKKSEIFPLSEIEFEGRMFKAPYDVDAYLKRIYGNYMEIPSSDKIEDHCFLEYKVDTQPREDCMTFHKI